MEQSHACNAHLTRLFPLASLSAAFLLHPAPSSAEPAWKAKLRAQDAEIEAELGAVESEVERRMEEDVQRLATAAAPGAGAGQVETVDVHRLRQRIEASLMHLQDGLVERGTEVRLLLLAALCGEHLLLLGPPGTAKSELGRRLNGTCGAKYFERLLTRFSVPEELFGPVSLRGLEEDEYVRKTEGYLPEANVAFVDEIFKANSAILNSLLTILNERLYDNGKERVKVPLLCLVGASNELPESEELDALYDRFLLRRAVAQVSPGALPELLRGGGTAPAAPAASEEAGAADLGERLELEDFRGVRAAAEAAVSVPDEVVDVLVELRSWLQDKCEPPVYVSDRRLLKAVSLLKVAAYTAGRAQVSIYDCLLLQHVMWQRPEDADKVQRFLLERLAGDQGSEQTSYLLQGLFARACRVNSGALDSSTAEGEEAQKAELEALLQELGALREMVALELGKLERALGGGPVGRPSMDAVADSPWMSAEEAEDAAQALAPVFQKGRTAARDMYRDVLTLEVAMQRGGEPHVLALLLPELWHSFIRGSA